jgi:DNA-binding NarL/FixJ family response regulator
MPRRWRMDFSSIAARLRLSCREIQIIEQVLLGRTIRAMARALRISENTIREHSRRLYKKLDVHDRGSLFRRLWQAANTR